MYLYLSVPVKICPPTFTRKFRFRPEPAHTPHSHTTNSERSRGQQSLIEDRPGAVLHTILVGWVLAGCSVHTWAVSDPAGPYVT